MIVRMLYSKLRGMASILIFRILSSSTPYFSQVARAVLTGAGRKARLERLRKLKLRKKAMRRT